MLAKLAVAATLVVGQVPTVPNAPAYVDDAMVLNCDGRAGTVWRVSGNRYVTALHVNGASSCTMRGLPMVTIRSEPALDFSVLVSPSLPGREYEIECGGFVAGETYIAVGWARGTTLVAMPMVAAGRKLGGASEFATFDVLRGTAFPGQSGGPVIRRSTGRVAGIVNAGNDFGLTLSRPLSETSLCNGSV